MKLFLAFLLATLTAVAQIPNTFRVTGPVAPPATNSNFGAALPVYNYGGLLTGLSSLSQLQDLNRYPLARRHAGMKAVLSNGAEYTLDATLTNWWNSGTATNIAHLRLIEPGFAGAVSVLGYYSPGDGGGGDYVVTNTVTGTNLWGGRIVASGGAKSWQLNEREAFSVLQFGAKNDNTGDQQPSIQACIEYAKTTPVIFPLGTYRVNSTISAKEGADGVTGRTLRGLGHMGTPSLAPTTSQRSAIMATHTNAILDVTGFGTQISGLSFIFATEPTTNDTSMNCIKIEGNLVWSRLENLRFVNGFRAIHNPNNNIGQIFSCTFSDWVIDKFVNTAIFQDAPGTQNLWNNIYIKCKAPVGATTQESELASSISLVNSTNLVFFLTPSFASQFSVGQIVNIQSSGGGGGSLNGNKTVVGVGSNFISVDYDFTISPAPTSATVICFGGSGKPNSYVIKQNTFCESNWNNLNIEWLESLGCIFGRNTTINGLHLEGINFSGSAASWFKFQGPATINGWQMFNSFVGTNQTVYLFSQTGTNGVIVSQSSYMRDMYYNPGSALYLFGFNGGTQGNNYYANHLAIESGQWNRVSNLTGIGFGQQFIGIGTNGVLSLGSSASGQVLNLIGGTAGVGIARFTRSGIATNDLSLTTGGYQWKDVESAKTLYSQQLINSGTQVLTTIGSTSGSSTPLVSRIRNEPASGSNIAGSDGFLDSGTGTGTGNPSSYFIRVPTTTTSGSGAQSLTSGLQINMGSPVSSNTALFLSYFNGTTWITGQRLSLTNIGGVTVPYLP